MTRDAHGASGALGAHDAHGDKTVSDRVIDLGVFGDVVLADGRLQRDAWVAVDGGRIVAVSAEQPEARRRDHLPGHLVLPGVIDAHVHTRSSLHEGIAATTRAAAAGGVTTVIDMPFDAPDLPVNTRERFAAKVAAIADEAHVDVALYATFPPSGPLDAIAELASAGACGFKVSLYGSHPVRFPRIPDGQLLKACALVAETDRPLAAHQENQEIVDTLIENALAAGQRAPLMHARTRPPVAETEATGRLLEFAHATGARLHVVHGTVPRTFGLVDRYRQDGVRVSAETCVHYLLLDETALERLGGRAKCNPPLRSASDVAGLWDLLADGRIDLVASDHSPYPLNEKDVGDIFAARPGLPGVETLAVLLYSEGVAAGRLSLARYASLLSSAPAATFGFQRKGSIAPGMDADLMVLDPDARHTIRAEALASPIGWTPFDGREVRGRVVRTYLRGALAFDGVQVTATPGSGRFVGSA